MGDEVRVLTIAEIEEVDTPPPDTEGRQDTRHLLNGSATGTPAIYADHVRLAPGFIHHLHRHPNADQFVLPLSGRFLLADEEGEETLESGQLGVIQQGSWHSLRNGGDEDAVAVLWFPGVGSIAEAGYELHHDPQLVDRRLAGAAE